MINIWYTIDEQYPGLKDKPWVVQVNMPAGNPTGYHPKGIMGNRRCATFEEALVAASELMNMTFQTS